MYLVFCIYLEDFCFLVRERYDEFNIDCRDDYLKFGD